MVVVKEDFKVAYDLFDKSCSLGSVEGYNLGTVSKRWEGERDYTKVLNSLTPVVLSAIHLPVLNLGNYVYIRSRHKSKS